MAVNYHHHFLIINSARWCLVIRDGSKLLFINGGRRKKINWQILLRGILQVNLVRPLLVTQTFPRLKRGPRYSRVSRISKPIWKSHYCNLFCGFPINSFVLGRNSIFLISYSFAWFNGYGGGARVLNKQRR